MGVADSIFKPHPSNFGKSDIFWRSSNDITITFGKNHYCKSFKKCTQAIRPGVEESLTRSWSKIKKLAFDRCMILALFTFFALLFSQLCIKHEVNHVSFTLDSLSHSAFILRSVAAYKCFQRSVSSKDHTGPICYHTLLRKRFSSAHNRSILNASSFSAKILTKRQCFTLVLKS